MTNDTKTNFTVRPWRESDASQLLALMRGLAEFEGYGDAFAVTEADLLTEGLGPEPAFGAFVAADDSGRLLGMAVTFRQPWTYDRRPWIVLKELFVHEEGRGRGVGSALLEAVIAEARAAQASRINWLVLRDNHEAAKLYRKVGGRVDEQWNSWTLEL